MSVKDALLMFRTSGAGNLTADASVGPVTIYGTKIDGGVAVEVNIPSANGANDTFKVNVYDSADGSTYNLIASSGSTSLKPYGGKMLAVPLNLAPGKHYLKVELDGTANSTTFNFGAVVAGIVTGRGADVYRGAVSG